MKLESLKFIKFLETPLDFWPEKIESGLKLAGLMLTLAPWCDHRLTHVHNHVAQAKCETLH